MIEEHLESSEKSYKPIKKYKQIINRIENIEEIYNNFYKPFQCRQNYESFFTLSEDSLFFVIYEGKYDKDIEDAINNINNQNIPESEKHEQFINDPNINGTKYSFIKTENNKFILTHKYKKNNIIKKEFSWMDILVFSDIEYLLLQLNSGETYGVRIENDYEMTLLSMDENFLKNIKVICESGSMFIYIPQNIVYSIGRPLGRYNITPILFPGNQENFTIFFHLDEEYSLLQINQDTKIVHTNFLVLFKYCRNIKYTIHNENHIFWDFYRNNDNEFSTVVFRCEYNNGYFINCDFGYIDDDDIDEMDYLTEKGKKLAKQCLNKQLYKNQILRLFHDLEITPDLLESELPSESELESETESELESELESEPEPEIESELESESESGSELESESADNQESESKMEEKSESADNPEIESKMEEEQISEMEKESISSESKSESESEIKTRKKTTTNRITKQKKQMKTEIKMNKIRIEKKKRKNIENKFSINTKNQKPNQ